MGNKFLDALEQGTNTATTLNGAVTNRSSLDYVLDYFALAGAMRERPKDAAKSYLKAFGQDPLLATKVLFYLRDVRGGQGERIVFATAYRELFKQDRELALRLLPLVPTYGYWKEVIALADIEFDAVVAQVRKQLDIDRETLGSEKSSVSLLAKWLPSVRTGSAKSRLLAARFAEALGMKPREYRKLVAALRARIRLLEQDMSAGNWDGIDYGKLPGQAFRKHIKAFKRHTPEKFEAFTQKVVKGEAKVNADTIYPYDAFEQIVLHGDESGANAMWASLPDYTRGTNALVIADVSGSMTVNNRRPLATSVSLALYFAERNQGMFNGYFMTFSQRPQLQRVVGATLSAKMNSISTAYWEMNTNLAAAFDAILKAAVDGKADQDELPRVLYVISDMEFDVAMSGTSTNFTAAKKRFADAGYTLPHVVFWNVNSVQDQLPATKFDSNVTLISGSSASTFKHAVEGKTPLESMLEVLSDERYAPVEEVFKPQ